MLPPHPRFAGPYAEDDTPGPILASMAGMIDTDHSNIFFCLGVDLFLSNMSAVPFIPHCHSLPLSFPPSNVSFPPNLPLPSTTHLEKIHSQSVALGFTRHFSPFRAIAKRTAKDTGKELVNEAEKKYITDDQQQLQ